MEFSDIPFEIINPEKDQNLSLRINRAGLSTIQFIQYISILAPPIDENEARRDLFMRDIIRIAFNKGINLDIGIIDDFIVPSKILLDDVIPNFLVSQKRDVEEDRFKEILVELCNLVDGPIIEMEGFMGWGLKADRNYKRGELITDYGGMKNSHDLNESLREEEMAQFGNTYTLSLTKENEVLIRPEQDWVIDGYIYFHLFEKGRWINTDTNGDNNAQFELRPAPEFLNVIHPADRKVVVVATKSIQEGEWIHADYGEFYPRSFFRKEEGESASKRPKIGTCIKCTSSPRKRCTECGAEFCNQHVDAHTEEICIIGKGLTAAKAREILHHGKIRGHTLTDKQRRYFGWVASGKKQRGRVRG